MQEVFWILWIPFAGSVLGSLAVFFVREEVSFLAETVLSGLSAGVMVAASVFSLLIPAIEESASYGFFAAIPSLVGLAVGFLLMRGFDCFADRLMRRASVPSLSHRRVFLLTLAVTIHNLPEGMAVGVALAGLLSGESGMTLASVMALAVGVAIQNIPEGSIISLPLSSNGMKTPRAFFVGVLSGAIEPIGAALTLLATGLVLPILPYLLGFAAGAMLSVVVSELIPATIEKKGWGSMAFAAGFSVMPFLDVALG